MITQSDSLYGAHSSEGLVAVARYAPLVLAEALPEGVDQVEEDGAGDGHQRDAQRDGRKIIADCMEQGIFVS